jgi:hypothetical protein
VSWLFVGPAEWAIGSCHIYLCIFASSLLFLIFFLPFLVLILRPPCRPLRRRHASSFSSPTRNHLLSEAVARTMFLYCSRCFVYQVRIRRKAPLSRRRQDNSNGHHRILPIDPPSPVELITDVHRLSCYKRRRLTRLLRFVKVSRLQKRVLCILRSRIPVFIDLFGVVHIYIYIYKDRHVLYCIQFVYTCMNMCACRSQGICSSVSTRGLAPSQARSN